MMRRRSGKGFTLIELLVVLAIIGILSVIAIVNYLAALTRARQKRTVADIRTIGMTWEARAGETIRYNAAGFTFPTTPMTHGELSALLTPTYTRTLPTTDGWSRPLQFAVNAPAGTAASVYGIRSSGRDGLYQTTYTPGSTDDPDCDIVYSAGSFVVYPGVMQTDR